MTEATARDPDRDARVMATTRPEPALMKLYCIMSLAGGPFFFLILLPLYFRYHTLRYRFGEEGVSVSWGILFKKEHHLTYPRIQDIHVSRGIVERWLGIATVSVQTASGSGAAEAEIVGLPHYEDVRDFLYARMRGLHEADSAQAGEESGDAADETTALLLEIRDALRDVRERLPAAVATDGGDGSPRPEVEA